MNKDIQSNEFMVGLCNDCYLPVRFAEVQPMDVANGVFEDLLSFEHRHEQQVSYVFMTEEPNNLCECELPVGEGIYRGRTNYVEGTCHE